MTKFIAPVYGLSDEMPDDVKSDYLEERWNPCKKNYKNCQSIRPAGSYFSF